MGRRLAQEAVIRFWVTFSYNRHLTLSDIRHGDALITERDEPVNCGVGCSTAKLTTVLQSSCEIKTHTQQRCSYTSARLLKRMDEHEGRHRLAMMLLSRIGSFVSLAFLICTHGHRSYRRSDFSVPARLRRVGCLQPRRRAALRVLMRRGLHELTGTCQSRIIKTASLYLLTFGPSYFCDRLELQTLYGMALL
jgi:hypothetical protein